MLKKLLIATGLVAGITAAHAATVERPTRISIDTAVDLPAPVEIVWAALIDTSAYPDWNPYHVSVEGDLAIGEKLNVRIEKPNGHNLTIYPSVLEIQINQSLVWGGGPRGLFRGEHRFDLERISPDCTRLHHTEVFAGLFVSFAQLDAIEPGYQAMNEALRNHLAGQGYTTAAAC